MKEPTPDPLEPPSEPKGAAQGSPDSSSRDPAAAQSFSPASPKPPQIPDYDLLRRIGIGAYGEVWLARSKATGVLRAAKIVWRSRFADERPFQREFEGIRRFEQISREHPSQLALFHIGRNVAEGYFYYVMELADPVCVGDDVRSPTSSAAKADTATIEKSKPPDVGSYKPRTFRTELESGRLPAGKVVDLGVALTEALSHLHANGLVHRDVKPSNVIFVNGRPKLADIGLVTDASDQCSIVGTEGYLPPEGPGTPQADIFALGKVLYEAATGMDRREYPKLPSDLRAWPDAKQISELNEIILKACAQEAKLRYQNCEEMHAELALLVQGKSIRQKRTRQQRLAILKKVMAGVAVMGVLAASAVVLWRQPHAPPPLSKNPQAVELYQQAVYQLHSGTTDRHMLAYTNLLEAVKLDPEFVDAYYMIAEAYFNGDFMPPYYNQLTNTRVVVAKLRELSPDSAQYYAADSSVKFMEWKFDDAIREIRLAIKLNPKFVRAHTWYGNYMMLIYADAETALKEYRIAEKLDPADETIQRDLGESYFLERKYDEAIKQYNMALQLEPRAVGTYYDLFEAYEAAGQHDKALDSDEQFILAGGWGKLNPEKVAAFYQVLRKALREQGPRGVWEARLKDARLKDARKDPLTDTGWIAVCYGQLGDTNEMMHYLNRAYNEHNGSMISLLYDAYWDPYRADPRFQELVRKMGFHPIH